MTPALETGGGWEFCTGMGVGGGGRSLEGVGWRGKQRDGQDGGRGNDTIYMLNMFPP